ncbi:hypothetical protein [Azospirillum sp. TSO5]|uniref:hypothetical protein n=1 Tax=Azospirillum sp. TSO5 TaxID=716760 RepID=UPI000D60DF23|nr:hypothetical protein [Azospirillum sp. TSO5]PWC92872.1 hypothetical protein TSO5_15690 [Azospirillum sp. TSO5]
MEDDVTEIRPAAWTPTVIEGTGHGKRIAPGDVADVSAALADIDALVADGIPDDNALDDAIDAYEAAEAAVVDALDTAGIPHGRNDAPSLARAELEAEAKRRNLHVATEDDLPDVRQAEPEIAPICSARSVRSSGRSRPQPSAGFTEAVLEAKAMVDAAAPLGAGGALWGHVPADERKALVEAHAALRASARSGDPQAVRDAAEGFRAAAVAAADAADRSVRERRGRVESDRAEILARIEADRRADEEARRRMTSSSLFGRAAKRLAEWLGGSLPGLPGALDTLQRLGLVRGPDPFGDKGKLAAAPDTSRPELVRSLRAINERSMSVRAAEDASDALHTALRNAPAGQASSKNARRPEAVVSRTARKPSVQRGTASAGRKPASVSKKGDRGI